MTFHDIFVVVNPTVKYYEQIPIILPHMGGKEDTW